MLFMLSPLPELAILLPIPILLLLGGGGILKELFVAGFRGAMLNEEYVLLEV
jgi:hypothetical protein